MSSNLDSSAKLAPFESALFLLESAEERMADLDSLLAAFMKENGPNIVIRNDPQSGEYIYSMRFQPVSWRMRKLAGDIFSDIRHALDHAFSDAALQINPSLPPDIHFPVASSVRHLEDQMKRKCRGVDPAILESCRALEPYQHGKGEFLWVVSRIAGLSKHRNLSRIPLVHDIREIFIPDPQPEGFRVFKRAGASGDELEFARSTADLNRKIAVTTEIVVDTVAALAPLNGKTPVRDIIKMTESVVMRLKSETERILHARS